MNKSFCVHKRTRFLKGSCIAPQACSLGAEIRKIRPDLRVKERVGQEYKRLTFQELSEILQPQLKGEDR